MTSKTVISTVALADTKPSVAVSFKTYVPAIEKLADVVGLVASTKVTEPGPLTLVQSPVGVEPGYPGVTLPCKLTEFVGNSIV